MRLGIDARLADTQGTMRFGSLAIVAAAAAAGALVGYYASAEGSRATATAGGRTVTVTRTVVRTIARPDRRAGKRVFVAACSRCHSLEPGDRTAGRINLAGLQPSYQTTLEQVKRGGIAMPSFEGRLSEREIRDVAAFVAAEARRRAAKTR